jgi:hypothetical protein
MALVKQPSKLPTNKLAAGAVVSSIVGTQAGPLVQEIWPQLAPAVLAGPVMTDTLAMLIALLSGVVVGWFVPDQANVRVDE